MLVHLGGLNLITGTMDWQQALPPEFAHGVQLLHANATLVAANRPGSGSDPRALVGFHPADGHFVWNGTDAMTPDKRPLPIT